MAQSGCHDYTELSPTFLYTLELPSRHCSFIKTLIPRANTLFRVQAPPWQRAEPKKGFCLPQQQKVFWLTLKSINLKFLWNQTYMVGVCHRQHFKLCHVD